MNGNNLEFAVNGAFSQYDWSSRETGFGIM